MANPMEAGRALDALVAERAMGWAWEGEGELRMFVPPVGDERRVWAAHWDAEGVPHFLPAYSTDIAAAWLVVAAVQAKNPGWRFSLLGGDVFHGYVNGKPSQGVDTDSLEAFGWYAEWFGNMDPRLADGTRHGESGADTPEVAICLAALAALASLVPEAPSAA